MTLYVAGDSSLDVEPVHILFSLGILHPYIFFKLQLDSMLES